MKWLLKELVVRGIKLVDLGYIGATHFLAGFFISRVIDDVCGPFDANAEKKKSTTRILLEVIGLLWFNAVVLYIIKNTMELIPSPLDGLGGFEHARVKELKSAPLLAFALLYYQSHLQEKLKALYNRFAPNKK